MHGSTSRAFARVVTSVWLVGCSAVLTEPVHDDVDRARRDWLARDVRTYSFEVSTTTSWFPPTGYVRVQVTNRQVASATAPDGAPIASFTLTIDEIWNRILDARTRNEVNSVSFDSRGVPVETDLGPWPVDGGAHYSVRAFQPAR